MNNKPLNLKAIQDLAKQYIVFDAVNYPLLAQLQDNDRLHFALAHSILHQQKGIGALSSMVEDMDHGGMLDRMLVLRTLRKSIVNALRIADLANISAEELEEEILTWAKEKEQEKIK